MRSLLFITIFITLAATAALSQASQSVAETPEKSQFGLIADTQISTSLHEVADIDRSVDTQFVFMPSIQLNEDLKLGVKLALIQNILHERETKLKNTKLSLSHSALSLNPFLSIIPSISATFPTDTILPRRDSFLSAATAQAKVAFDFSRIGLTQLSLLTSMAATKNAHEFETNRLGESNTSLSLLASLNTTLHILQTLSLELYGERSVGFTYQGTSKNNFELTETLSYTFTPQTSFSLGHSNAGAAYRENGTDSRVALFNPNDSTVFVGMTIIF